ncbi:MAG: hypothetical protein LBE48_03925 [Methanomassiliicoccaceae archaeon]|jgi:hypothetical protein|nr:hypothetical protein [Methanomassiliicoccaceae archaeon]
MAVGRRRLALILSLLWAITAAVAFCLLEIFERDLFWGTTFVSLFLLVIGVVTLFGNVRFFFPFTFLSKEDLSAYNIEKISFLLGILTVALSYASIFVALGGFLILMLVCVPVAAAVEILSLYCSAANRFRADTRPKI